MRGERQRRLPVSARLQHHSPFPRQVARAEPGGWMVIEKAAVYPEPIAQYPQVHILISDRMQPAFQAASMVIY